MLRIQLHNETLPWDRLLLMWKQVSNEYGQKSLQKQAEISKSQSCVGPYPTFPDSKWCCLGGQGQELGQAGVTKLCGCVLLSPTSWSSSLRKCHISSYCTVTNLSMYFIRGEMCCCAFSVLYLNGYSIFFVTTEPEQRQELWKAAWQTMREQWGHNSNHSKKRPMQSWEVWV